MDPPGYWPIYAVAAVMMLLSLLFALAFDPGTLRRARRKLRRRTKATT
jgi:hypothetical protein